MKTLKDQVKELTINQNHILEKIKYLNESLEAIIAKNDNEQIKDVKNIVESQAMIDELIVKNADDIISIKKLKNDNSDAIKTLEAKIDLIDEEIGVRIHNIQANVEKEKDEQTIKVTNDSRNPRKEIRCKHFNAGYCKMKNVCSFKHKSVKICESHRKMVKCENKRCELRHPRQCRYFRRNSCWRGESCVYLHETSTYVNDERKVDPADDEMNDNELELMETSLMDKAERKCGNCKADASKNQCNKCMQHFCSDCEIKINGESGESVFEYFKRFSYANYTCNTTHYSISETMKRNSPNQES